MAIITINKGSDPSLSTHLSNPRLLNMYVGNDGLYRLPNLKLITPQDNTLLSFTTTFNNGYRIIITNQSIYRIATGGQKELVSHIKVIGNRVTASENQNNQITITTGAHAYVFDQRVNKVTTLGTEQGFGIKNPIATVVLNNFTVIIGGSDNIWTLSKVNNALIYDNNEIVNTDTSLGELVGVVELNNNLFIFGKNSAQRWVPSLERTTYDFPFTLDPSFRTTYGAKAPDSIISTGANIYYLGDNNVVQSLSNSGQKPISTVGISKAMLECGNVDKTKGSYFHYNGDYFYSLSFDSISWVYCESSNEWTESNTLINSSEGDIVTTKSGVYSMTNVFNESLPCILTTEVIYPKNISSYYRSILNEVNFNISQGLIPQSEDQYIELSISTDSVGFSNVVKRKIASTGDRKQVNIWKLNLSGNKFSLKFGYYGDLDIVFEKLDILIN